MKLKIRASFFVFFSLLSIRILPAQGAHVVVSLISQEEVEGDLLSLADESFPSDRVTSRKESI